MFLSLQSFLPFSHAFTRCTCFLNSLDQVLDLNSTIFQGLVIRDSRDRGLITLGLWKDSQETHGSRLNMGHHNHGKHHCWLVVWNMDFIFPCIGNNNPNCYLLHHFSEGLKAFKTVNHQPDCFLYIFPSRSSILKQGRLTFQYAQALEEITKFESFPVTLVFQVPKAQLDAQRWID